MSAADRLAPRPAVEGEETFRACADCLEEIKVISAGDESWDFCEACCQVEGNTCYVNENGEVVDV